jgi:hypothetical protein
MAARHFAAFLPALEFIYRGRLDIAAMSGSTVMVKLLHIYTSFVETTTCPELANLKTYHGHRGQRPPSYVLPLWLLRHISLEFQVVLRYSVVFSSIGIL